MFCSDEQFRAIAGFWFAREHRWSFRMYSDGNKSTRILNIRHIRISQTPLSEADYEDDCLSILTMSSPRSRTTSDVIFADFESVMARSGRPPVGTTRPPLYPSFHGSRYPEKRAGIHLSRSRSRVVNKPIRNRSN